MKACEYQLIARRPHSPSQCDDWFGAVAVAATSASSTVKPSAAVGRVKMASRNVVNASCQSMRIARLRV